MRQDPDTSGASERSEIALELRASGGLARPLAYFMLTAAVCVLATGIVLAWGDAFILLWAIAGGGLLGAIGLDLLLSRLVADRDGLSVQRLGSRRSVAWADVQDLFLHRTGSRSVGLAATTHRGEVVFFDPVRFGVAGFRTWEIEEAYRRLVVAHPWPDWTPSSPSAARPTSLAPPEPVTFHVATRALAGGAVMVLVGAAMVFVGGTAAAGGFGAIACGITNMRGERRQTLRADTSGITCWDRDTTHVPWASIAGVTGDGQRHPHILIWTTAHEVYRLPVPSGHEPSDVITRLDAWRADRL